MTTQSVLDLMTSSVIERKAAAGAKLTPVGLEATRITGVGPAAGAPLPHTAASFPNDVPDEALLSRVSILEELFARIATLDEQQDALRQQVHAQYAAIREAMDAVKVQLGQVPADAPPAETKKAKERAADARVAAAKASDIEQAVDDGAADEDDIPGLVAIEAQAVAAAALAAVAKAPTTADAVAVVAQFNADFNAMSTAAQEATFAQHPPRREDSGWECPVHKVSIEKTSRLGRTYRACNNADCKQFEKL